MDSDSQHRLNPDPISDEMAAFLTGLAYGICLGILLIVLVQWVSR